MMDYFDAPTRKLAQWAALEYKKLRGKTARVPMRRIEYWFDPSHGTWNAVTIDDYTGTELILCCDLRWRP